MVKVATYGGSDVAAPRPMEGRLRAADAGDGGLGRSLQNFGQQLGEYADSEARTRADDLLLQADARMRAARDNFTQLQGKDALDARGATAEAMKVAYADTIGATKDRLVRGYLGLVLERARIQYDADVSQHGLAQEKAYTQTVGKAKVVNFASTAADNWDKPERVAENIMQGREQVRVNLAAQGLADPEIVKAQSDDFESGVHKAIVDRLLVGGDIEGASAYLNFHADRISAADELGLRQALKGPLEKRQAADDAMGSAPGFAPPSGSPASAGTPRSGQFAAIIAIEGGTGKRGQFLTSPKGAIGPAQVMPGTAPEAARLAGLKWDETKYRSDPAYNKALGEAYFKAQLQTFRDPDMAAAAYNAGPKRVADSVAKGGDWLARLPAETRKYVKNFRAKTGGGASAGTGTAPEVPDQGSWIASIEERATAENWTFERREAAKDYARAQVSDAIRTRSLTEDAADRQAQEIILGKQDKFTDTSMIPRGIWADMSPSQRSSAMTLAKSNSVPKEPPANSPAMWQAHATMYADPEQFKRLDLTQYIGKVTRAEMDSLISEQAKLRKPAKPGADVSPRSPVSSNIAYHTKLDSALDKALDPKTNPEAYARVAQDMEKYVRSITGGKRAATDAELDTAFKRATMTVIVKDAGWFGSDKAKPRYALEGGEEFDVEIPADVRKRIETSLTKNFGRFSSTDVARLYVAQKGKPGFW